MMTMTFELKDKDLEKVTGGTVIPYVVYSDDTLENIAKYFKCSVEDLKHWNNNLTDIKPGQTLYILF